MVQMVNLQVVVESHDPFPVLEGSVVVHEIELHVIEMGLVELFVLAPIERDGVKLNLRKKDVVSAEWYHHGDEGVHLVEMDIA